MSPHTSSTPNINTVRLADSRGSLISTDSGNSLLEKNNDKANSLDKVCVCELRSYVTYREFKFRLYQSLRQNNTSMCCSDSLLT